MLAASKKGCANNSSFQCHKQSFVSSLSTKKKSTMKGYYKSQYIFLL